jgi:hypothetical protein
VLLTSVRNEGINLIEWLSHSRAIGIESVVLYTNDNSDASDELIDILAKAGILLAIKNTTRIPIQRDIQKKIFNHALFSLPELWNHEWVFFADADEFLLLNNGRWTIAQMSAAADAACEGVPSSGICFNWKWFGSEGLIKRKPGLALEIFNHSRPDLHVKTIARLREITGFHTCHIPQLMSGGFLLDGGFEKIKAPTGEVGPVYKYGQLNHYWHKSFEEFVAKKLRSKNDRTFEHFFVWQDPSLESVDRVPPILLEKVKVEIESLGAIPGVGAQLAKIENRFQAMLREFDSGGEILRIYNGHRS